MISYSMARHRARYHCRTCLVRINFENKEFESETTEAPNQDTKDLCIDITKNDELQTMISKYIGDSGPEHHLEDFPQHICLSCFSKLQQVDRFLQQARKSAEKLRELFDEKLKDEFEFNNEGESSDIFKLFLKDSLMEMESVLLDNTATSVHNNTEVNHPDPFSNNTDALLVKDNPTLSMDDSEIEESDDDDREWAQHSLSDSSNNGRSKRRKTSVKSKICKSEVSSSSEAEYDLSAKSEISASQMSSGKPATRLRVKLGFKIEELPPTTKRKKRRTKKEMEEFRREQLEREENKNKRRQKGTKNNFKCTQCNHCFAHKITLDAHIRKVHEGSKRPFRCDRCEKSYTFIGGLYTHIKEIHEAEVRSYACDFPDCDRIYTSFIAMQKHKRLKHTDTGEQKKYVCEQCGATFNQTGNLKYHRRTKHPTDDEKAAKEREKERFECTICKKLFHSRYTLKYHTLQLHTNETKYECNVCGRKMAKKFMLVQHMLVHSTEKMPCEHCGKQFIRKFELEAHIRAVHMKLKPFECQYCSECFASRKTLRHHEYIHTGEKPYVCDLCGQAYRQQTCLKNHRKSHEKIKSEGVSSVNLSSNLISSMIMNEEQQEATAANLNPTAEIV